MTNKEIAVNARGLAKHNPRGSLDQEIPSEGKQAMMTAEEAVRNHVRVWMRNTAIGGGVQLEAWRVFGGMALLLLWVVLLSVSASAFVALRATR